MMDMLKFGWDSTEELQSVVSNVNLLTDIYRDAICQTRYILIGTNVVDMCVFYYITV